MPPTVTTEPKPAQPPADTIKVRVNGQDVVVPGDGAAKAQRRHCRTQAPFKVEMNMQTLNLFEDLVVDAPATEGIKYAGSKLKLLPYILQLVRKVKPDTVLDGFSGTTRVSQALAQSGHRVIANDIAAWSRVLGTCYLLNPHPQSHYQPLIEHLNALPGKDGWFSEHYGGEPNGGYSASGDNLKKPWQRHNTRKLDAIREEIDLLALTEAERAVLLTSLILALDEVDSTLGHFAS